MKINYIVEGQLETPVARRLIEFCNHQPGKRYCLRGSGEIKKKARQYFPLASDETAALVLTDFMDAKVDCPALAKREYIGESQVPQKFLLRFAIPELESWLLADKENFAKLLGVKVNKLADSPEIIPDPKRYLANLARQSRKKRIKDDFISSAGRQGIFYIPILTEFVQNTWDINIAMGRAPSLERCIRRLRELAV